MAGFQVIFNGRFWVITEVKNDQIPRFHTPRGLLVLIGRDCYQREGLQRRAMHRDPSAARSR